MNSAADDPPLAHDDSRRLPGPNRWFDRPAVVLDALGRAALDDAAVAAWAERVELLCAALGWPAPQPRAHRHAGGLVLAFAAPEDLLFTATEVNEWAWERSADARHPLSAEGIVALQPAHDELPALQTEFTRRAAAERSAPLQRLKAAARARGLPVFEDDDSLSIGAGRGSLTWPRAALPLPMDLPWARLHDVPTIVVTGSNGKTTTTRLLAAMARAAGLVPGLCSTEGVRVGDETVERGDYAGPAGARAVLRHPGVDFAVLETARGGLLRRGLALRRADAAVITNVSADHLGEYGIHSVADIAHAKAVVLHAVAASGMAVLNGGDAVLMDIAAPLAPPGRLALFAAKHAHPRLAAHRAAGGSTCGADQGRLLLDDGEATAPVDLGDVSTMPLTLGGAARYNLENIAAAVLAARATGLPLAAIQATLQSFGARPQDNPGRLERWTWRGATVLVDYAHNPDGLAQLLGVARALQPRRLGLLLGQAGNRDDAAIAELARTAAAFAPERIVVKELPRMLRGRALGEVPVLILATLREAGVPAEATSLEPDESLAAAALLDWAGPGDVLVLPVHTAAVRETLAQRLAAGPTAR
jgi:UDP-N-acetylmuramyl tripeptide synthase